MYVGFRVRVLTKVSTNEGCSKAKGSGFGIPRTKVLNGLIMRLAFLAARYSSICLKYGR